MNSTSTNKINASGINIIPSFEDAFTRQLYLSNDESLKDLVNRRKYSDSRNWGLFMQASVQEPISKHKYNLTYFESSLFATVLEDTLCALQVLEECNNTIRVVKTNLNMNALLAYKFAVPPRVGGDELDDIDPKRLDCLEYKLQKLEDDRKYVKDILLGTYIDLSLDKCYLYMTEQSKIVHDRFSYRESLVEEEANNKILRRDLNRQLRHQRNHIKSVYYETNSVIEKLRTNVEDAGLNTRLRSRYVKNWQQARTEQHQQTIQDKEAKPLANIMHYKRKTDQEHRVHTEIELLMNITINEILQKIEEWMSKYDKDMETIDLKIQKKRNQLDDMINRTASLEKTIEEHAQLSKNWVTFKEQREEARLYREKMNDAAITIQSWWRGLLVRNQLGPYKVVKKPPPPPGGGKKK